MMWLNISWLAFVLISKITAYRDVHNNYYLDPSQNQDLRLGNQPSFLKETKRFNIKPNLLLDDNQNFQFSDEAKLQFNDNPDLQYNNDRPNLRVKDEYPLIVHHKKDLRIRGGEATDTKNYRYIAAIVINGRLWCAGAIVDVKWVITAAHCLNYVLDVSPLKSVGAFVKVRVGSARAHEGGQLMDVAGAVRHPKFEEEPVPHADVALLKLKNNIAFNSHVDLIKIYDGVQEPFAQSFVVVTGWGATRGTDTAFKDHTPDLLTTRLKVRSQHYCIDAYQLVNGFQFTPDFFCASLRNGTRDACLFDAGAPAMQQNRLMGIMSFGPERCGHEFQPAVFIKAFYFRDFVKQTIASYKTTKELIDAIAEIEPEVLPVPVPEPPSRDQINAEQETPREIPMQYDRD